MINRDTIKAVKRFGLGARPGEVGEAAPDPRGYVLAQLNDDSFLSVGAELPSSIEGWLDYFRTKEMLRMRTAGEDPSTEPSMTSDAKMPSIKPSPRFAALEGQARVTAAIRTGTPFAERLTSFWANHFCVSTSRPFVNRIAGAYEREAIRPYVLGRFRSMLGAVAHHPAMLSYLDNVSSVGPHSAIGQKRKKGLNENLGREMLELHTLGADGGYTQEDVTNLAKALTGWTFHKDHSEKAGPSTSRSSFTSRGPSRSWASATPKRAPSRLRPSWTTLRDIQRPPITWRASLPVTL